MLSEQPFMKFEIREKVNLLKENRSLRQLASLDLQPIVKVYESENNIEISGYLVLNGEFANDEVEEDWEEEYEQSDGVHAGSIFAEQEEPLQFQYQIPLSIQVQPERVSELSQVFVDVDFFDYEVLSEQEMELVAHVRLVGIHPYVQQDTPIDILNDQAYEEYDSSEYQYADSSEESSSSSSSSFFSSSSVIVDQTVETETVSQQVEKEQPAEMVVAAPEPEPVLQEVKAPVQIEEPQQAKMKIGFKKRDSENSRNEFSSSNPFSSLLKKEKPTIVTENENTAQVVADDLLEQSLRTELDENNEVMLSGEENTETEALETESQVKKDRSKTNLLFSLLQGNEESKKKIKIYFVQPDDTLEIIALKYNIQVHEILEKNSLPNPEVQVGQILYLPIGR